MVLYKKAFPLGKGVSFFQYITALRKAYFPNFVLAFEKIPSTENYQAEIFFTAPLWKWGLANAFLGGVFLNKCKIQYFNNDEEYIILQASPSTWNLLASSLFVIAAFLFLLLILFTTITKGMLPKDIFLLVIFIVIWLTPLVSIYFRDKRLLDKIGSLAIVLNKK